MRVTIGLGGAPVPVSGRLCGLPEALSAIWTLAARLPRPLGEKTTLIEQVAFTASVAGDSGQSELTEKSPGFAPVVPTLEIVNGAVPVFFSVELCDELDEPTSTDPKARLVGVSDTAGAATAPA